MAGGPSPSILARRAPSGLAAARAADAWTNSVGILAKVLRKPLVWAFGFAFSKISSGQTGGGIIEPWR